ncbi:MAG: hypothetical protein WCG60_02730, partial [bacterium]
EHSACREPRSQTVEVFGHSSPIKHILMTYYVKFDYEYFKSKVKILSIIRKYFIKIMTETIAFKYPG